MTPLERYAACLEPQTKAAMPFMYTVPLEAVLQMALKHMKARLRAWWNLRIWGSVPLTSAPRTIQILISPIRHKVSRWWFQTDDFSRGGSLPDSTTRCSFFFALCTWKTLRTLPKCSSTWGNRGWCRLEKTMRELSDGSWILIRKC